MANSGDRFIRAQRNLLLAVDYFSRYPEIVRIGATTTSSVVIAALRSILSRHSIPGIVSSDNGPQYSSQEFAEFAHGSKVLTPYQ